LNQFKYVFLLSAIISLLGFSNAAPIRENHQAQGKIGQRAIKTAGLVQIEKEVLDLVNFHRKRFGLELLVSKPFIVEQAREHSADMAWRRMRFGHDGSAERVKVITTYMKEITAAGENVLFCTKGYTQPAASAVEGWMKSPGHRANILGDYDMSGVGVERSADGSYYFTQIFIRGVEKSRK